MAREHSLATWDARPHTRRIASAGQAASCFFRSAAGGTGRKALVQITERCNLHCAHCFVSSTRRGSDMDPADLRETVFPRLLRARVERLTLTGGEPFVHPSLLQICTDAIGAGLSVGICTNGTGVSDEVIGELQKLEKVHVNVSFDGFRAESHGRFRGNAESFSETVAAARRFGAAGLLQGFLSTPNVFASVGEYTELAAFALENDADYLLMNPLSAFGRGVQSKKRLAADVELMKEIRAAVEAAAAGRLEIVPIRFPNDHAPLGSCIAGEIIYIFVDGAVAVCPYLVFAARTPQSRHSDSEFIIGNILKQEIAEALDAYRFHERYQVGANETCTSCGLSKRCGKGCPAAVIAAGGIIGERDIEPCPIP
jgi:radical SAM protein with 4Fe4S-binding SPASM domain